MTALIAVASTSLAAAHFVFIVPDPSKPERAIIVQSEDLAPDGAVDIGKIAGIKALARDGAGKETPGKINALKDSLELAVPPGTRFLYGSHDYGVMQRGEGKPFLLRYHAKAILGDGHDAEVGKALPLEIVPKVEQGKVRFLVLAAGKPLAKADVTIAEGEKKEKIATDAEGLTPAYPATGRYGLWAKFVDPTPGSLGDKKYEEIRHYSSLVVDFPKK
jgi:hypothetical protein